MNSSPITAIAKQQLDKPLLQNLLPQSAPQKEFADIFISTQSQTTNARDDRGSGPERNDHSSDDHRLAASRDDTGDKRENYKRDTDEPDNLETKGDESAPKELSTNSLEDNPSIAEGVTTDELGDEGVSESSLGLEAGDGSVVVTAGISEHQPKSLDKGEEVESIDAISHSIEGNDSVLMGEEPDPSISYAGLSDSHESHVVDVASAGAIVIPSAKAEGLGSIVSSSSKLSIQSSVNSVPPALAQQTQSGVDPSSQVIEVEQLLSDKPSAAISIKSSLDIGMKPDSVLINNDNTSVRVPANLILSGESSLTTKEALKDMLGAIKIGEPATKSSVSALLIPSALDAKPLAPQTIQFQAAVAKMPAGMQAAVGQPGWGQAVGERVLMMAAKNLQAAEIQLDPPELGQLQVRIVMNQDQASVSFVSPQQSVREALDESAQRLRDMFDAEGVELTDVDVSDQSQSNLAQDEQSGSSTEGADNLDDSLDEAVVRSVDMGLVDHYV